MSFWWFGFGGARATESERQAALSTAPLERLQSPHDAVTLVAGGRQTKGALPVQTRYFDGAIYSSRGRGYARYNEDGAALFSDEQGRMYGAVFDQAGGLGGRVRGEASKLAAIETVRAFRRLATGQDKGKVTQVLVEHGIMPAHAALVARNEGEVTTAVIAALHPDRAHLASSGDSAAVHFTKNGKIAGRTRPHEVITSFGAGALTHAVGMQPEGPSAESYTWPLATNDWILMCSDGLLDSGLSPSQWHEALRTSATAEDAVNALAKRVLRRMTWMRAKPDNLTILAVRRRNLR